MKVTCREELRRLIGNLSLVTGHLSLARLLSEAERATWPDIGGNAICATAQSLRTRDTIGAKPETGNRNGVSGTSDIDGQIE